MYINQEDEIIRFEAQDITRFDECVDMIKSTIRRKSNSVIIEMIDIARYTVHPFYHVAKFTFKVYEDCELSKIDAMMTISQALDECREWISLDLGLEFSDYDVLAYDFEYDDIYGDCIKEIEYTVTVYGEMRHGK